MAGREELEKAASYFKVNNLLFIPPIARAAYSDRTAWIMASMSQLAYEKFEDGGEARQLLLEKLKGGGFALVAEFTSPKDDPYADTQAFLASNGEYAVLAFRGTEVSKRLDITTDITASMVSLIEGEVHRGFINAYKSVEIQIMEGLKLIGKQPLYITGHSLGAALATVATQYLERDHVIRDQIAACYTFGSPRVGNEAFDQELKSMIYRVVNTTDIVTVFPLLLMGYIHIGDVRFLGRGEGEIRRGIPILRRIQFFLATLFRLLGPLVGDHGIVKYRAKLAKVARGHNSDLFVDGRSGGK
jgi:hypothetical protein